jgi:hypothetical protein
MAKDPSVLLVAGLFGSSLGQVQKIVLQHRDCLWAARPGPCLEGASDNLQGLLAHNTASCPLRYMPGGLTKDGTTFNTFNPIWHCTAAATLLSIGLGAVSLSHKLLIALSDFALLSVAWSGRTRYYQR